MANKLNIPKQAIDWLIGRLHVSTSDDEVRTLISARTKNFPGWNYENIKEAQEYAVKSHRKNQGLYETVMSGRL